jgi:acetyl-CoA carboxylase biotin carboxyl carrier protein
MATTDVISPVTGSVWKLECTEGQQVAEDDVLMILESMKMEVPVTATASGTVEALKVAEGAAVEEDAVLCIIKG